MKLRSKKAYIYAVFLEGEWLLYFSSVLRKMSYEWEKIFNLYVIDNCAPMKFQPIKTRNECVAIDVHESLFRIKVIFVSSSLKLRPRVEVSLSKDFCRSNCVDASGKSDSGRFGDRRFGDIMATDVSATKCRRNVFAAETSFKKLKTFVLEYCNV